MKAHLDTKGVTSDVIKTNFDIIEDEEETFAPERHVNRNMKAVPTEFPLNDAISFTDYPR